VKGVFKTQPVEPPAVDPQSYKLLDVLEEVRGAGLRRGELSELAIGAHAQVRPEDWLDELLEVLADQAERRESVVAQRPILVEEVALDVAADDVEDEFERESHRHGFPAVRACESERVRRRRTRGDGWASSGAGKSGRRESAFE
jgi:hypothetical protein